MSSEPVFPKPQLRIYAEADKLKGRENYVQWRRMIVRELRMVNLLHFVESSLGIFTKWSKVTRQQGDALAQKVILDSVTPIINAQIQFCKHAYDMWSHIKYAYEDIAILQLNSAIREVHQIIPESCESVHEIFDKLLALRTASIEMGENLPESYWLTEATHLVYDYHPHEVCEAPKYVKR